MIICFNCSSDTKTSLDDLMATGQYKDYSEAISAGVANQLLLHGQIGEDGTLVLGGSVTTSVGRQDSGPSSAATPGSRRRKPRGRSRRPSGGLARRRTIPDAVSHELDGERGEVPDIFRLDGIRSSRPRRFADPLDDQWVEGQDVPLDQWIFGQFNKLLPAKASCRALAQLTLREPEGVPLEAAASTISDEALRLGNLLRRHDKAHQVDRDSRLATAFPASDRDSSKSRDRYANQFVGTVTKAGQTSGLLAELKMVNCVYQEESRLLLTEAGWQFAMLFSPVLDGSLEEPRQRFSDDEIGFLLTHIVDRVPRENFAYRTILDAIHSRGGKLAPIELDAALETCIPAETKSRLSKAFWATQRSGAVSRMVDLGLVSRVRDAVRVSYVCTDRGEKYAKRTFSDGGGNS